MSNHLAQLGLVHGAGFEVIEGVQHASRASIAHAEEGARLIMNGNVELLLCSGRGPLADREYPESEAEMMRNIIIKHGVDKKRVSVEEDSHSTLGNWAKSAEIIESEGIETVIGITGRAHVRRAMMLGIFVASISDFELVGYRPVDVLGRIKDHAREMPLTALTYLYIARNYNTSRSDLVNKYDKFMSRFSAGKIKKQLHRDKLCY